MSKNEQRKITPWACIAPLALAVTLAACGGGGGGGTTTVTDDTVQDGEQVTAERGFTMPSEITAVPASSSDAGASSARLNRSLFEQAYHAAKALTPDALSATSDYATEKGRRYVHTGSLEVFSIIETILNALGQTKYGDASVLNQGPYSAMISWEEKGGEGGNSSKMVQEWVVDSQMLADADAPNGSVNLVQVWIPEDGQVIKAQFRILDDAEVSEDGEALTMGVWEMNVVFDNGDGSDGSFRASASVDANGFSVLTIHEADTGHDDGLPSGLNTDMMAVLRRKADQGYGKVEMPNWEAMGRCNHDPGLNADTNDDGDVSLDELNACLVGQDIDARLAITYAYNGDYLIIDEDGDGAVDQALDRDLTNAAEVTHRYGVYYADAAAEGNTGKAIAEGDNVLKHNNFGFPVRVDTDGDGTVDEFGFYGAFQGNHQLWAGGSSAESGALVVKEDWSTGDLQTEEYEAFPLQTTLAKRKMVAVSLADVEGVPLQANLSKFWDLTYVSGGADGAGWYMCAGWVDLMDPNNPVCMSFGGMDQEGNPILSQELDMVKFDAFALLDKADFVSGFYSPVGGGGGGGGGGAPMNYSSGDGAFNVGTPSNGDRLFVSAHGQLWLKVEGDDTNGYDWSVLTPDNSSNTWPPAFSGQAGYTFPAGDDIFVHSNGAGYVIRLTTGEDGAQAADYKVLSELQTVANPANVANFIPDGVDYLAAPWGDPAEKTRYTFDGSTMLLMDGSSEVTQGQWGLVAYGVGQDATAGTDDDVALTIDDNGTVSDAPVDSFGNVDIQNTVQFNYQAREQEYGQDGPVLDDNGDPVYRAQQTYLLRDSQFVILDNPIILKDVPVYRRGSDTAESIAELRFDGWMHGLPDLYQAFQQDGGFAAFLDKVVTIHEGTEVEDASGTRYFVKPMETSVFLDDVTSEYNADNLAGAPELTDAVGLDLDAAIAGLPASAENTMGDKPADTTVLFIEGVAVQ